jgi:uncharacterized protein
MSNRLTSEASPYLLQHAHNPVDWHPWGPEALEKARREDKPILLSIGYAACHWCHVMERESFENEAVAQLMNDGFVNIKVDREERPDLDQIYQLVVQLMGRSGGWPLTVFLTPDQRPFFAGTYFPPADRFGMPGFPKVLTALAEAYREKRGAIDAQAGEITQAIGNVQRSSGAAADEIGGDVLGRASRKLLARFDDHYGGFGGRPKFPNTMAVDVLLRRAALEGDAVCGESVRLALDRMRAGGIWDHLRGGFHRYSTDERWLVPHFEKMLYDNALLLRLYTDGYRAFGAPRYAEAAREIVGYLFAEMRSPEGAFYASQDADSEGYEGKFFVWTLADLKAAVGDGGLAYDAARLHFGITEEGNFEESSATVLSAHRSVDRVASILGAPEADVAQAVEAARSKMLAHRELRPRPLRDDKVLASWNGLLIGALADAGCALSEPSWVEAAVAAFDAIFAGLIREGRVARYLKDGKAASLRPGFLDDQAYVGNAALDLYEATGEPRFAACALAVGRAMLAHHWDAADGGFFFTPDDGDALIARTKDAHDQAIPAAASMAALLCLRLGAISDESLTGPAEEQLLATAKAALENPFGLGQAVLGLDRLAHGSVDVVVVGARDAEATRALTSAVFKRYLPDRSVVVVDPSDPESAAVAKVAAAGKEAREGSPVAYVCRGHACSAPVTTVAELQLLLDLTRR